MTDDEILAAVLLGASALLLILTVIVLCVLIKWLSSKRRSREMSSEIPMGKTNHQYFNYALEQERNKWNTGPETTAAGNGQHKAEWPANYNMYAISRSYAFPKTGDTSTHDSHSVTESVNSRSLEISHKTFSEEVFEKVNQVSHVTVLPAHTSRGTSSVTSTNSHRVWKHHSPSETMSQTSLDRSSLGTTSTASYQHHSTERPLSYYSTFKSRNVSVSSSENNRSTQNDQTKPQKTAVQRERISSQKSSKSREEKAFTFNTGQHERPLT